MRVCIVADSFPKLSETFVLHQVEGLRARGHEVSVLCNKIGPDAAPCDVRRRWAGLGVLRPGVDHLPSRFQHKARRTLDRLDVRHLLTFDVILAHFGYEGARLAALAREVEGFPPLVTIYHGHDVATVAHSNAFAIYDDLFQYGALHLPVNNSFRETLIAAGAPRDRTVTHRMGIDLEAFPFEPRDWSRRPIEILSVCRLTEKKGITYALEALEQLHAVAPQHDWQYRIVGDGEDAHALEEQVSRLGTRDRITLMGAQPHDRVRELISQAHLFLLPSVTASNGDAEGVPVSLMEAMASGAVPVSTHHSGIPELIEDGRSGFLAHERDAGHLAETLRTALAASDQLADIAEAGRKRVSERFNARHQIDLLERQLSEVVNSTGRSFATGSTFPGRPQTQDTTVRPGS